MESVISTFVFNFQVDVHPWLKPSHTTSKNLRMLYFRIYVLLKAHCPHTIHCLYVCCRAE